MAPMRSRTGRARSHQRVIAVALLAAFAGTLGLRPGTVGVALAADTLRIQADATYELDPRARRVHVAIDVDLTNLKPSTATTFFYYSHHLMSKYDRQPQWGSTPFDLVQLRVANAAACDT